MRSLLVACLVGVSLGAGAAQAQFGRINQPNWGPGYRNNVSPYLNILRGRNTGIDYYLGTRSEFQRRANAQEFRDDLGALQNRELFQDEDIPQLVQPIPSGAFAVVNNTGGYFNNTQAYFSYPGSGGNQPIRPGIYTPPPRRSGSAPRRGSNPGFSPTPGPYKPQNAPPANPPGQ
ncbi:MAG: hypothetical protein U0840_27930 [Gemmataceae bacterium]